MESEITQLQIKMAKFEEKVDNVADTVKELKDTLNEFIAAADTKYAAKWAEKAWTYVIATIGGIVLVALMGVIIVEKYGK